MESRSYLDTHVVVWLFHGRTDFLSPRGREVVASNKLLVSPMVLLELEFLRQIDRLSDTPAEVVLALQSDTDLTVCDLEFGRVIESAIGCDWTRDPFDRLIVGQARAGAGSLLTRDLNIRRNAPEAIW